MNTPLPTLSHLTRLSTPGLLLLLLLLLPLLSITTPHSHAATLFVAPNGNDAAAGTADAPLRSLHQALQRTRSNPSLRTILLAHGRYELDRPLDLGNADSHLTLAASPGSNPTLSGGRRLTGWTRDPARPNLWKLDLPEVRAGQWYFHQLFVDGQRAPRARTPNQDFFRTRDRLGTTNPIVLPFHPGDIQPAWTNHPDARLVMLMKWTDLHVPITTVDPHQNLALLPGGPRPYWMDEAHARYWVENVPDALDAPHEWYLDRRSGSLAYLSPPGLDPNTAVVVAPRLTTLIRLSGNVTARQPLDGVTLRGLTLAETDYEMPAEGMISPQAAVPIRGAIRAEHSINTRLENCRLENLGGYALDLGRGCQRWTILGNEIRGAGAGGIRVGEPGDKTPDAFDACQDHEIADNHLHQLGRIFAPAVGLIVFQSGGNRIHHNEIADLYYTAISIGWNWGYQETPCRGNIVEFNHLHHIGQGRLSDMGGIYTLGIQPGTVLRNNLIHDVTSYDYGGWGLYTDEGSTGILLENNVVYHCKSAGFHQHYGRENTVRNNIFAFNRENQLMRTRDEEHLSFFFTNNIVYFDSGRLLGSSWKNNRFVIDSNLYFDTRAGTNTAQLEFSQASWQQWQARGHDLHSRIANPRFVDPTHFNFNLLPDSPALDLGFRPINLQSVGPRKKPTP